MNATVRTMVLGVTTTLLAACGVSEVDGSVVDEGSLESVDQGVSACDGFAAATCGYAMNSLDGVTAYSNGQYMRTGNSCASAGTYGSRYQCVEYARRYWALVKGKTLPKVVNACDICDQSSTAWVRYWPSQGSTYIPVKGDLFVKPCVNGGTGHVAVVSSSTSTTVNVVEQNYSCTGWNSYSRTSARCIVHPL